MPNCVTIISGGMDSTVLAYHLKKENYTQTFLSFDYGQKHKKELVYAARTAETLYGKDQHQVIDLRDVTKFLTTSSLTSDVAVPDGHYNEDSMRSTVVPNRNAMMLSVAYSIASAIKAEGVAIGVHSGDRYNYPDCRIEFTAAFQAMENEALKGFDTPHLITPFINISKADIAAIGRDLHVPFEKTWSCYKGGRYHCGRCGTCVERLEALNYAQVKDKTKYQDKEFWKEAVKQYKESQSQVAV